MNNIRQAVKSLKLYINEQNKTINNALSVLENALEIKNAQQQDVADRLDAAGFSDYMIDYDRKVAIVFFK